MRGRKRKLPRNFVPAPWLSSSDTDEPAQQVQRLPHQQQQHHVHPHPDVPQQPHGEPQHQLNDDIFVESGDEMFFEIPENVVNLNLNLDHQQQHVPEGDPHVPHGEGANAHDHVEEEEAGPQGEGANLHQLVEGEGGPQGEEAVPHGEEADPHDDEEDAGQQHVETQEEEDDNLLGN